ncbi:ribosome silencing factor [Micrococcales bacterium 31B]|nr:ribosome silencing factor [Micrococcales bacterium 31B]
MPASDLAVHLARAAARAAAEKLADEIVALDVSEQLVITDAFVLASGSSERQVSAIVDAVEEALRKEGQKPLRREGERDARWVLLDFAEIVVHVQHAEDREYYSLERLWRDCPAIDVSDIVAESANGADAGVAR